MCTGAKGRFAHRENAAKHGGGGMSRDIGTENRAVLRILADILVPAGDGMPSASEAGVAESGIDEVLNIRPDLYGDLSRVLRSAQNVEPADALNNLASQDP